VWEKIKPSHPYPIVSNGGFGIKKVEVSWRRENTKGRNWAREDGRTLSRDREIKQQENNVIKTGHILKVGSKMITKQMLQVWNH